MGAPAMAEGEDDDHEVGADARAAWRVWLGLLRRLAYAVFIATYCTWLVGLFVHVALPPAWNPFGTDSRWWWESPGWHPPIVRRCGRRTSGASWACAACASVRLGW